MIRSPPSRCSTVTRRIGSFISRICWREGGLLAGRAVQVALFAQVLRVG